MIPARTASERRAYVAGYIEAVKDVNDKGMAWAIDCLRGMAEAEGMIDDQSNGKDSPTCPD